MKISAQNMTPGTVWKHTMYGNLEAVKIKDEYRNGRHMINILADRHGRFVYEAERMLELTDYSGKGE